MWRWWEFDNAAFGDCRGRQKLDPDNYYHPGIHPRIHPRMGVLCNMMLLSTSFKNCTRAHKLNFDHYYHNHGKRCILNGNFPELVLLKPLICIWLSLFLCLSLCISSIGPVWKSQLDLIKKLFSQSTKTQNPASIRLVTKYSGYWVHNSNHPLENNIWRWNEIDTSLMYKK